ncbi:MAG: hypothetical protein JXO44_07565 [Clostridia bacterium]|nr:hypothetical protein [Clostridia bacterium]
MLLTIGFKFCGGCNPRYDRRAAYERMVQAYSPGYKATMAKSGESYDILVIIAGCKNACANYSDINYTKKLMIITSEQLPI